MVNLLNAGGIPAAGIGPYATILRPTTAGQWAALMGDAPNWSWEFQQTSGNLAASIGAPATMTANSTGQNYQQSVTNWTTKWCGTDVNSGHGWVGPNNLFQLHNTSIFAFCYFCLTGGIGSYTSMLQLRSGRDLGIEARPSNSGFSMHKKSVNQDAASAYLNATPTPHPLCCLYDVRGSGLWRTQTDLQQGTQTYGTDFASGVNRTMGIGQMGANSNAAGARYNYLAIWAGAAAERLIDLGGVTGLGGKTFLRRLGWSPP